VEEKPFKSSLVKVFQEGIAIKLKQANNCLEVLLNNKCKRQKINDMVDAVVQCLCRLYGNRCELPGGTHPVLDLTTRAAAAAARKKRTDTVPPSGAPAPKTAKSRASSF
jgi:hypothetical protein